MKYFLSSELFLWIASFCEESVNLARIEQEYEECQWIPCSIFEDMVSKSTMDQMISEIKCVTFSK